MKDFTEFVMNQMDQIVDFSELYSSASEVDRQWRLAEEMASSGTMFILDSSGVANDSMGTSLQTDSSRELSPQPLQESSPQSQPSLGSLMTPSPEPSLESSPQPSHDLPADTPKSIEKTKSRESKSYLGLSDRSRMSKRSSRKKKRRIVNVDSIANEMVNEQIKSADGTNGKRVGTVLKSKAYSLVWDEREPYKITLVPFHG